MNEYLYSSNLSNGLWIITLVAGRFYGAMYICPLFNDSYLTRMLKILLSLFVALIIFPYFNEKIVLTNTIGNMLLLVKELLVGVMLSYLFSLPIWLIENTGNIIDMQRGEQLGAIINQSTKNPSSSISALLMQGVIVYIVAANGLTFFFQVMMQSFLIFPINKFLPDNPLFNLTIYINYFGKYCYWVTILALPIVFMLFLIDIVMGLIGSFIPTMNITILSMPIKGILALFFLNFYVGILYYVDSSVFMDFCKKILLN